MYGGAASSTRAHRMLPLRGWCTRRREDGKFCGWSQPSAAAIDFPASRLPVSLMGDPAPLRSARSRAPTVPSAGRIARARARRVLARMLPMAGVVHDMCDARAVPRERPEREQGDGDSASHGHSPSHAHTLSWWSLHRGPPPNQPRLCRISASCLRWRSSKASVTFLTASTNETRAWASRRS